MKVNLRASAVALALVLVLSACSPDADNQPALQRPKIVAQVASYDIAVGPESRFIVGILDEDGQPVLGGDAQFEFRFVGATPTSSGAEDAEGLKVPATFLAIPAEDDGHEHEHPSNVGVYAARIAFDRPGFWGVHVTRGGLTARAAFEVLPQRRVPGPGDDAPRTENAVAGMPDMPIEAIDSRAGDSGAIPDPELHNTTIKQALDQGRPVLAVFSTPVYCVSRFCGPITDVIHELALAHPDKAAYVHVEIWRNRQENQVNKAAAEWIFREGNLQEPWVFLIGGDGKIIERWDNVATRQEIEPLLLKL